MTPKPRADDAPDERNTDPNAGPIMHFETDDKRSPEQKAAAAALLGTAEDLREQRIWEFSQWVADGPIFPDGVTRSHNDGDAVADAQVQLYGWDKTVPPKVRRPENWKG